MDMQSALFREHPERRALNAEMHARPPEALPPSARISYFALTDAPQTEPVADLCRRFGVEPPPADARHVSLDLGPFRLKWERHTEFARYKFIAPVAGDSPLFDATALSLAPADWIAALPGQTIAAAHIELRPAIIADVKPEELSATHFGGSALVGALVAGDRGAAFGDFRLHEDGFGRAIVYDAGMTPRQRGRTVQRLVEIDAYCMMSLLTFPVARETMAALGALESDLRAITDEMRTADREREPELLDRITRIHADLMRRQTATQFRMSAARAYSSLVADRIGEMREQRIEGIQTFAEFMARRLDPAMKTCDAASLRLALLSESVAHATQLLQTRVDVTREEQNQALLESMDRRAKMQLRLQETVEGLSMAAITYYIVGLVGYAAAGLYAAGLLPVSKEMAVLASIPVVILLVAWLIRHAKANLKD